MDAICHPALALYNSYSDCAIFPAYKILAFDSPQMLTDTVSITIANTRSIYQHLDPHLVLEFERRGITYHRLFPSEYSSRDAGHNYKLQTHSWERIFKTTMRTEVERKCRENGLSFSWRADSSIEVWNCAPACISHPGTRDRLWFNQVHAYRALPNGAIHQTSVFSRLFLDPAAQFALRATFSDCGEINEDYLDKIEAAHHKQSLKLELIPGDILILDNAQTAQQFSTQTAGSGYTFALY
jgi:hypothetical protein